jgi:hypothetical protein
MQDCLSFILSLKIPPSIRKKHCYINKEKVNFYVFQPVACTGRLFLCDKLLGEAQRFFKNYLQKEFEMNKLLKVTSAITLALGALSASANASSLPISKALNSTEVAVMGVSGIQITEAKNMTKRTRHMSAAGALAIEEAKNMTKRTRHVSAAGALAIEEAKNMTKRTKHL